MVLNGESVPYKVLISHFGFVIFFLLNKYFFLLNKQDKIWDVWKLKKKKKRKVEK